MSESFSGQPFYNSDLPASMRLTHIGAERGAPFDPRLHLARITHMIDQVNAADEDGDYSDILHAERDALVENYPELRDSQV